MSHTNAFAEHFLHNPLQYIKGVGPNKASALKSLGCVQVKDILFHLPSYYVDRSKITPLFQAKSHQLLNQIVRIDEIVTKSRGQKTAKLLCSNDHGSITIVFFHITKLMLASWHIGDKIAISGKVDLKNGELQMIHPDVIVPRCQADKFLVIDPVYQSNARINSQSISKVIKEVLKILPEIDEWLPQNLLSKLLLPSWSNAMRLIHNPQNQSEMKLTEKAIERLALDEILAEQLLINNCNHKLHRMKKHVLNFSGSLASDLIKMLPFSLTAGQQTVLQDIMEDQKSNKHMVRILQGDVGSGKTIVAFLAALNAIEAGRQVIMMAPTELLAKQHLECFKRFFSMQDRVTTCLLSGSIANRQKKEMYPQLKDGSIDFVFGTHALIQAGVEFAKPGLIIIDEQHKFGVKQRLELLEKSMVCDLLMMSATPIPRTLLMMKHGNVKISNLTDKPAGRMPIETSILSQEKTPQLVNSIKKAIDKGAKAYWICPLIEDSEALSLNNVKNRYQQLASIFGDKVAMIHGKLPPKDKDAIMEDFASPDGASKLLVATTVIEVGVDVADATIIVIEHAERFGLSQMHQLRGRVGRGSKISYCILLYNHPLSATAKNRLEAMRSCDDGFKLSKEDLKIRGAGKIFSTMQSGEYKFRVYDYFQHEHLVQIANNILNNLDNLKILQLMLIYCDLDLTDNSNISIT